MRLLYLLLLNLLLSGCISTIDGEIILKKVSGGSVENSEPLRPFISLWRTTTPNEVITLPTREGYSYNFEVDWGDGESSEVTSYDDPDINHEYAIAGDYVVTIDGIAETWYFNNSGSKDNIIEVRDLGHTGLITLERAFTSCSNLEKFAGGYTREVTSTFNMFLHCTSLTDIDVSEFDLTNMVTVKAMFGNTRPTSLDLSKWNTGNIEDFSFLFWKISTLTSLDVSNFDTSKATSMAAMFRSMDQMTSIDVSNFDTSNVESFSYMFASQDYRFRSFKF